jgi:hypothetical protein
VGRAAGGVVTVVLSMPRLCPAPGPLSHVSEATSVTPTPVTIAHLPDTYGL